MAGKSKIEWTDATWNPIRGCSRVSEGCRNCYAENIAARFNKPGQWGHGLATLVTRPDGRKEARWTGKMVQAPEATLTAPLRWKKPRMIFVNSTSDLFHEDVPDDWIDRIFAVMALCPQHTFQVLTKRPERMREYMQHGRWRVVQEICGLADWFDTTITRPWDWPRTNVWLGTSVEDQASYDERSVHLKQTPSAVHFFSMEPLLGSISAPWLGDWVIVGGESGGGARPMHPDWARNLRDQCAAADVPFFFKQWGAWADHTVHHAACHACPGSEDRIFLADGEMLGAGCKGAGGMVDPDWQERGATWMCRVGKGAAGRLLDGVTHDGMPNTNLAPSANGEAA